MNTFSELRVETTSTRRLSSSEGMGNKVTVKFASSTEVIHEDPVTRTRTLIQFSNLEFITSFSVSIDSTCHSHIAYLLFGHIIQQLSSFEISATRILTAVWICDRLATRIASEASNLGFGTNGFEIDLVLVFATQRVVVSFGLLSPLLLRLVSEGAIVGEELKKLRMGKEPCSICLEDLVLCGGPTRLPCSHVFHTCCLLEWFVRKTTCPMCRGLVLSDIDQQRVSNPFQGGDWFWF